MTSLPTALSEPSKQKEAVTDFAEGVVYRQPPTRRQVFADEQTEKERAPTPKGEKSPIAQQ
jgi:hypothetical protein